MDDTRYDSDTQGLLNDMSGVLDAAYHRIGMEAPRHNGRPVMAMIRSDVPAATDDDFQVWMEAWRSFLTILFHEGPHPERVMRRLYAFVWAVDREKLANMSQTDLALLFKETRAAVSLRVNLLFSGYLKAQGFRATRVPGQKTEGACKTFARKAAGNHNRKSGRKKGDTPKKP